MVLENADRCVETVMCRYVLMASAAMCCNVVWCDMMSSVVLCCAVMCDIAISSSYFRVTQSLPTMNCSTPTSLSKESQVISEFAADWCTWAFLITADRPSVDILLQLITIGTSSINHSCRWCCWAHGSLAAGNLLVLSRQYSPVRVQQANEMTV